MTKYQPITFDEPWQAAKFVADGGELFDREYTKVDEHTAHVISKIDDALYTIANPAEWWEKLDGSRHNEILCETPNGVRLISDVLSDGSVTDGCGGEWHVSLVAPLGSCEIKQLLKNAPDYDGGQDD